jgi:hypothetical protein
MRLLSFVPCGCRAGPIDDAPPADHAGDAAAAARRRRRRRRAAAGSVGGAAAAQWRPSLGDIYEAPTRPRPPPGRRGPGRRRPGTSPGCCPAHTAMNTGTYTCHITSLSLSLTFHASCASLTCYTVRPCAGTSRARRPCRRSRRRRTCSDEDHGGVGIDHESTTMTMTTTATTSTGHQKYCLKHVYRLLSTYCRTKDLYASIRK